MPERTVSILAILKDKLSPGLNNVRKNFRGLRDAVGKLGGQFSFLTGTAAKFIGAFAGIQGIRRALDLAEKQVEATTQLASALEGLPATYAEINKAADEFQRHTTVGNEEFQLMAARLKEGGVAAESLAASTEAVFNAAAKAQKPAATIAEALIVAQAKGVALRGSLAAMVGDLTQVELKSGKAFDILAESTKGAAEALAQTPFGRAKQEANELGDTLEEIGMTLIDVKVAFLEAANKGVKLLLGFFQSNTWKVFAKTLGAIVASAIEWLPTIIKIVVVLKAWSIAVWAVVTAKLALIAAYKALGVVASITSTIILAPWLILPALIGAAVTAILYLVGAFDGLGGVFSDLLADSGKLFDLLSSGALSFGDALGILGKKFKIIWIKIKRNFFEPIVVRWKSTVVTLSAIWDKYFGFVADQIRIVVTAISKQISKTVSALASVLGPVAALAKKVAKSVASKIPSAFDGLDAALKKSADKFAKAGEDGKAALVKIAKESAEQVAVYSAQITKLQDEVTATLEKAAAKQKALQDAAAGEAGEAGEAGGGGGGEIAGVSAKQLQQEVDLAAQIRAVRANENQEALDILAKQEADALERNFRLGRISAVEFASERLRVAEETSEKEADLVREQIAVLEELADARYEGGQAAGDVLQKQLALEKELQAILGQQAEDVRAVGDEINVLAATLGDKATAAQDDFNASIQETAFLVNDGAVTQEEAAERNVAAMELFEDEIKRVQDELLAMQTQGGDTEVFEAAAAKIISIWDTVKVAFGLASDDMGKKAKTTWQQMYYSFKESMVQPIIDFSDTMADMFMGFETGFADTNDAFRAFGKQALKILLQIIQKWLIMRALGLPTFGSPAPANAGGLVHREGMVFAGGGHVPGPTAVHRDTVPAMLTPGEFVVRESAASYYGAGIMRAINAAMFPRGIFGQAPGGAARYAGGGFQAGGEVAAAASGAPQSGPSEALVVADEAAFSRLLAGGQSSFMRFIEAHKTEVAGILGS